MDALSILQCKLFDSSKALAYSYFYGIGCNQEAIDDLLINYNRLLIYNSSCDKDYWALCDIESTVNKNYTFGGCSSRTITISTCNLNITDTTIPVVKKCSYLKITQKL